MSDKILLRGIRAMGRHGVYAEEKTRPQPFELDVTLEVDTAAAGRTDDFTKAVDYSEAAKLASAVLTDEHHELLERIAQRVVEQMFTLQGVNGVSVEVRKMRPAMGVDINFSAVQISRSRADVL